MKRRSTEAASRPDGPRRSLDFASAFSRMAALCSTGEHCESEIRQKLQGAALSAADIGRVVDRLYDEGFMDTARYCRAFAHDRLLLTRWGRMRISQELRLRGLPETDIRSAIDTLPEEEYNKVLVELARQKLRTLCEEDEYLRRAKLLRFMAGRGFAPHEVERVVEGF